MKIQITEEEIISDIEHAIQTTPCEPLAEIIDFISKNTPNK